MTDSKIDAPLDQSRGSKSAASRQTLTRADLSTAVYERVGLSRSESADLVEAILTEVSASLDAGQAVKISGFGSFQVRQKSQRIGRNPKTGEEVPIPPRRVLAFRASAMLKSRLNRAGEAVMRNARQRRAR
jgi:integration host factor subunit alpha